MSVIDEIKSRLDIVDIVSESVQLRRSGKNYIGFCPFHSNTRTPAFVVFPETGTWQCFGQCNEGGDIFGFVMKKEGWDFSEALRNLADKAGVTLKPLTQQEQEKFEENDQLRELLEEAVAFYRHNLINTSDGKPILNYLHEQRGLRDETIEAFGLGYAPDSWDAALNHFISKGHTRQDLIASGLVTEREGESAGVYDRFRHRITIPIRDLQGRMAGFGARVVNPEHLPKFLNSPQTVLFDKGRLLFGLDQARKDIRAQDQAVIVEGYFDVITLHQEGFINVVSPMGTALTEYQLRMLKRFSRSMVLALDADAAGEKATLRGLQVARQSLDRQADPVFHVRGYMGFEARLNADIRVTTLPEGQDPDEIVIQDRTQWEKLVSGARPIVIHVMETLAEEQDIDDPKVKSRITEQVLPLISDVPNAVERDAYRQRLARLLRVDERALLEISAPKPRARRYSPPASPAGEVILEPEVGIAPSFASPELLESYSLSVLLRRPDLVYRVDRAFQENGLTRLTNNDFRSGDHQVLLQLIDESLRQDHTEPLMFVQNNLSLPLMELVDQLLVKSEQLDPNEDKVLEDLIRTLLVLRQRRLHQEIDHLRFMMEEAQQGGSNQVDEYAQTMVAYIRTRKRIDQALGFYTSRVIQ